MGWVNKTSSSMTMSLKKFPIPRLMPPPISEVNTRILDPSEFMMVKQNKAMHTKTPTSTSNAWRVPIAINRRPGTNYPRIKIGLVPRNLPRRGEVAAPRQFATESSIAPTVEERAKSPPWFILVSSLLENIAMGEDPARQKKERVLVTIQVVSLCLLPQIASLKVSFPQVFLDLVMSAFNTPKISLWFQSLR